MADASKIMSEYFGKSRKKACYAGDYPTSRLGCREKGGAIDVSPRQRWFIYFLKAASFVSKSTPPSRK